MTKFLTFVAATAVFASSFSDIAQAADEDIVTNDSRPGVTIGFVATQPAGPTKAAAILFTGGIANSSFGKAGGRDRKTFSSAAVSCLRRVAC